MTKSETNTAVGYRMDRYGQVFLRFAGEDERPASLEEVRNLLTSNSDISLTLLNKV
ncbi:MAG: hypothetical protein ISR52_05800 [Rhodospirillales bacterium]|nr:hypothetical protein [Rhodospirillales bacterium]